MRYKDFHLLKKDVVKKRGLDVELGVVKELNSMKDYGAFLERDAELLRWWRVHMGFVKDEDAP